MNCRLFCVYYFIFLALTKYTVCMFVVIHMRSYLITCYWVCYTQYMYIVVWTLSDNLHLVNRTRCTRYCHCYVGCMSFTCGPQCCNASLSLQIAECLAANFTAQSFHARDLYKQLHCQCVTDSVFILYLFAHTFLAFNVEFISLIADVCCLCW